MLKIKLNLRKFLYIFYEYFKILFESVKFWVKFANDKSMISNMAQNNPAALQSLQKEFGAGMTTQGQIGGTRAEGYGFKSMRYDDAAINYDNGKNIDALNTQAKNAKTIQNTPNEQGLKAEQDIKAKGVANLYKGQSVFGGVYKAIHGEDSKYPNLIKR